MSQQGCHGTIIGSAAASLGALQALAAVSDTSSSPSTSLQESAGIMLGGITRLDKMAGRAAAEAGLAMGLASLFRYQQAAAGVPHGARSQLINHQQSDVAQSIVQVCLLLASALQLVRDGCQPT